MINKKVGGVIILLVILCLSIRIPVEKHSIIKIVPIFKEKELLFPFKINQTTNNIANKFLLESRDYFYLTSNIQQIKLIGNYRVNIYGNPVTTTNWYLSK